MARCHTYAAHRMASDKARYGWGCAGRQCAFPTLGVMESPSAVNAHAVESRHSDRLMTGPYLAPLEGNSPFWKHLLRFAWGRLRCLPFPFTWSLRAQQPLALLRSPHG